MEPAVVDAFVIGMITGFLAFPVAVLILVSFAWSVETARRRKEESPRTDPAKVWGFEDHPQATYSVDAPPIVPSKSIGC